MGRGSGSGSDGSGGGKGSGKVAASAAAAVEWSLVNTTINRQKTNTWMADGSSKQNRLTFFPLPAATNPHAPWQAVQLDRASGGWRLNGAIHGRQWPRQWAGHESRRKEEEPGLRNVCLGEVFEWSVIILVILDKWMVGFGWGYWIVLHHVWFLYRSNPI
jgi:hypothetical protein